MPVEVKPLFRPDVLHQHLKAFELPERAEEGRSALAKWANLLSTVQADKLKEQELLADFLADVFTGVLGYARPADSPERYTISRERHVEVGGKFADAVIGEFGPDRPRFVIAVEGKGPSDPLDRPFKNRRMSAIDQGYRYAINLPCDWILVTSMRQTRLYYKGADQLTYERFRISDLAESAFHFKRFVFLLGAERVVPRSGRCHLDDLRSTSEKVGRALTKDMYVRYANMREELFEQLCVANPDESRQHVLGAAQRLLDRVLFCAFCEDRGLLPESTLSQAFEHRDPYNPRPIWENFRGLFHSINHGNPALDIPAYNGGLFGNEGVLDLLNVPDDACKHFRELGEYDYRPPSEAVEHLNCESAAGLIDVDILGHIFEQSITDLEHLRNELEGIVPPQGKEKHRTRRKKEGAFYTPPFITRYIVEQALGGMLADRLEALRQAHESNATGTAVKSLADPTIYDLDALNSPQRKALVHFWEVWQDELGTVRILDPACGSGAFLIEAFDQLHAAYEASNERLQELRGHRTLFDLDRQILQNNLYGVDLNDEAIEICRLSLWIKTAQRGKTLASLDHSIRVGNSVIEDPDVHPLACRWTKEFPEVFEQGGFDVVVGNPPYVRQEWLSDYKSYFQSTYTAYHGMADLYVYFYELGLRVLKSGGLLSLIVTNKWMKAGYGEPLRRFLSESAWIESVVDFGHARQIFADADVFPSIVVARKPTTSLKPKTARLCSIPRDQLRIDNLSHQIEAEGVDLPIEQLGMNSWQLEPRAVTNLLAKVRAVGMPLSEFAGMKPLSGIKTGLNDAFLVDSTTKESLVEADPNCSDLLRPYLRGQDFCRWSAEWAGLWMIVLKSSENRAWPWADVGESAETVFRRTYPSIYAHADRYRAKLIKRQDQGRYWWELRSCAYWAEFDRPKIMYPEITWRAQWGFDWNRTVCNNTAYFLPSDDLWILAAANAPITWWYSWRNAMHGKDEALRFIKDYVQSMPIPTPTDKQRTSAVPIITRLISMTEAFHGMRRMLMDWLLVEYSIERPSLKLLSPVELDSDAFVAEVKRIRGKRNPLSAAALKGLRDEYLRSVEPARADAVKGLQLERELSDVVNKAYGLTPEEVSLLWETAPPRMPLAT